MYQEIYVPIDGSEHANTCGQIALDLAKKFGARGVGVVDRSLVGSVCERVVRRARTDVNLMGYSGSVR